MAATHLLFRSLVFGSFQQPPTKSAAMKELVERGVTAPLQFLAHLDDNRTTKIVINHSGAQGMLRFQFGWHVLTTEKDVGR